MQERPRVARLGARRPPGCRSPSRPPAVNASTTSSISSSTADATAVADSEIVRIPAISARIRTPRPGLRRPVRDPHARPPSTARSSVPVSENRSGTLAREVDQRAPVAGQRVDRDPLVGAVMAAAGRAELDRRHARLQERDGVRGAVAPDAHRLAVGQPRRGLRERDAHTGSSADTRAGGQMNERATWTSGQRADQGEQLARVLLREIADVDVHGAFLGHLVRRVAADDPAEVHRRPVEQLRGLQGERHRFDSPEDVDRLQHRVVAEPRRRTVRGRAEDQDPQREHALGLDADVQVGGLAGDREIADVAGLDQQVRRALVDLLGLLVGHAHEADPHLVLVLEVLERAHHRGQAALHVIGAAALEPVALDARRELLRPRRDDVVVAVEDERRPLGGPDLRGQGEDVPELVVRDRDVARLEPALDESRARAKALDVRGVVRDQALREDPFVHPAQGSGGWCGVEPTCRWLRQRSPLHENRRSGGFRSRRGGDGS